MIQKMSSQQQHQEYEDEYIIEPQEQQPKTKKEAEQRKQEKHKQKRKRKNQKVLFTSFNNLSEKQAIILIKEMREKLKHHFIWHIGRENSTNKAAIFEAIMGFHPMDMDIYKRAFWWKVIDNVLKEMKHNDELFVVRRGQCYYVLSTLEEADNYKDTIDRAITNFQNSKDQAYDWVKNKKYKDILK
jgi:hypothetical protein